MISAVILTFNEERNIAECIQTLQRWCSDIIVYDSFSTDQTVELARSAGARVFQREFDDYASQRNAALHEVDYLNDWILVADADERWDESLGKLMLEAVAKPEHRDTEIFYFQRKDIFLGRWLKHGIGSGTWSGRLLKKNHVTVVRAINEEYQCSGKKVYLTGGRFLHYPFNNGVDRWISRHNQYSGMEAVRLHEEKRVPLKWRMLLSKDPAERRKSQKQLLYRFPGRPLLMFFVLYFLKAGFLDGKAGFHYAVLRSFYEYMIDLKTVVSR